MLDRLPGTAEDVEGIRRDMVVCELSGCQPHSEQRREDVAGEG